MISHGGLDEELSAEIFVGRVLFFDKRKKDKCCKTKRKDKFDLQQSKIWVDLKFEIDVNSVQKFLNVFFLLSIEQKPNEHEEFVVVHHDLHPAILMVEFVVLDFSIENETKTMELITDEFLHLLFQLELMNVYDVVVGFPEENKTNSTLKINKRRRRRRKVFFNIDFHIIDESHFSNKIKLTTNFSLTSSFHIDRSCQRGRNEHNLLLFSSQFSFTDEQYFLLTSVEHVVDVHVELNVSDIRSLKRFHLDD